MPEGVNLVLVSKFQPDEAIMEAYNAGQRHFGESRAQELIAKHSRLPEAIVWHFIGHLQTNKVKAIVPFASLIHSVESLKLLSEINKEASKIERVCDCLLQFYIAAEETKFGLNMEEAVALLTSEAYADMKHIRICGVMGMATFTDDMVQVRSEFEQLKTIFDTLKNEYFSHAPHFCHISMGMSDDYPLAIECGSTMVRVGSAVFGSRNY